MRRCRSPWRIMTSEEVCYNSLIIRPKGATHRLNFFCGKISDEWIPLEVHKP